MTRALRLRADAASSWPSRPRGLRSRVRGCSIRDIAEQANILSGSLYHHFSSKDEMVIEILDHYWHTLFDAYDGVLARG